MFYYCYSYASNIMFTYLSLKIINVDFYYSENKTNEKVLYKKTIPLRI
jgi:hypothetical protein